MVLRLAVAIVVRRLCFTCIDQLSAHEYSLALVCSCLCVCVCRTQIIPLWAAIGAGAALCAGFMVKYFSGHTEISFSKSMRATYDHQGLSESRVASHNTRFGFRSLNKHNVNIFPFNFLSMENITKKHGVNYPDDDE